MSTEQHREETSAPQTAVLSHCVAVVGPQITVLSCVLRGHPAEVGGIFQAERAQDRLASDASPVLVLARGPLLCSVGVLDFPWG